MAGGADTDQHINRVMSDARDILYCTDTENGGDVDEEKKEYTENKDYKKASLLTILLNTWNVGRTGPGDCNMECNYPSNKPQQPQPQYQQQQQQSDSTPPDSTEQQPQPQSQQPSDYPPGTEEENAVESDNAIFSNQLPPSTPSPSESTPSMSTQTIIILTTTLIAVPMIVSVVIGILLSRNAKWNFGETSITGQDEGGQGGGKSPGKPQKGKSTVDPLTLSDSLPQGEEEISLTPTKFLATQSSTTDEDTDLLESDDVQVRDEELEI